MAINGVIFESRDNTAKNWGSVFQSMYQDGKVAGCDISVSSAQNTVTIGAGYFVAGGRIVQLTAPQTISITGAPTGLAYARIKFVIDLSQAPSENSFEQGFFAYDFSATTTFTALIQQDINGSNLSDTSYESQICIVGLSSGSVTDLVEDFNNAAGPFLPLAGGTLTGSVIFPQGIGIKSDIDGTQVDLLKINASTGNIIVGSPIGAPSLITFGAQEAQLNYGSSTKRLLTVDDGATYLSNSGGNCTGNIIFPNGIGLRSYDNKGNSIPLITINDSNNIWVGGATYTGNNAFIGATALYLYYDSASHLVLTSDNYGSYALPRAGGTMTGIITLGEGAQLRGTFNDGETGNLAYINQSTNVTWLGSNSPSAGDTYIACGPGQSLYKRAQGESEAELIDANNYATYGVKLKRPGASSDMGVGFYGAAFVPITYSTAARLDDTIALGWSGGRWSTVYATTSTISTSDAREKRDITDIEHAKALVMAMKPRQYKFNNGVRTHYGFVAQEFEEAMHKAGIDDCAALIKGVITEQKNYTEGMDEDEYKYGLRYEELIAPLLAVVQEQEERIKSLEARLGEIDV